MKLSIKWLAGSYVSWTPTQDSYLSQIKPLEKELGTVVVIGDGVDAQRFARDLNREHIQVPRILTRNAYDRGIRRRFENNKQLSSHMQLAEKFQPDLFVVYSLGLHIDSGIVDRYQGILLNVHAGPLPETAGIADPIQREMHLGRDIGTVVLHEVDNKIDAGAILREGTYVLKPNHKTNLNAASRMAASLVAQELREKKENYA